MSDQIEGWRKRFRAQFPNQSPLTGIEAFIAAEICEARLEALEGFADKIDKILEKHKK